VSVVVRGSAPAAGRRDQRRPLDGGCRPHGASALGPHHL